MVRGQWVGHNQENGRMGTATKTPRIHKKTRKQVKAILEEAFRREFPQDTVDVSDGYQDNIHVIVVSRRFDKMTERKKEALMWGILDSAPLTKNEKLTVSLLYALSPRQIKSGVR
jgi:acid stress-induced BolA-like protein IbaG/YrbA